MYIVLDNNAKEDTILPTEACPESESNDNKIRVYFSNPFDLDSVQKYIVEQYKIAYENLKSLLDDEYYIKIVENFADNKPTISGNRMNEIIATIREKDYEDAEYIYNKPLYAQQEKARQEAEKARIREENARLREEKKAREKAEKEARAKLKARTVIQLDDDGKVIKEFESASEAASETGIYIKCIRDAAAGVQKHAGGFCWKYKE